MPKSFRPICLVKKKRFCRNMQFFTLYALDPGLYAFVSDLKGIDICNKAVQLLFKIKLNTIYKQVF